VIEAFFVALLDFIQKFFAVIASVINIILEPIKIILSLIGDFILRAIVIATIPFKILFAALSAVWAIYRSLWEPMLMVLLYPFTFILNVFLIVWEAYWSFWGSFYDTTFMDLVYDLMYYIGVALFYCVGIPIYAVVLFWWNYFFL
jgi:hypothetical protein